MPHPKKEKKAPMQNGSHEKKKKRENDAYKLHMSHYMPPTVLFYVGPHGLKPPLLVVAYFL